MGSIDDIKEQYVTNMGRAMRMESLYEAILRARPVRKPGRPEYYVSDILRSSVVLLHASLEDFLRSLLEIYLPEQGQSVLDRIPLVGLSPYGQPKKFLLGDLHRFKGKRVEEILLDSVRGYLSHQTYNNSTDVATALADMSLDAARYTAYYPRLDAMIARRHNIVHRADKNEIIGRGHHLYKSIGRKVVSEWTLNVVQFCRDVLTDLGYPP